MKKTKTLKEAFRKFRHGIAYLIAPDWIDDLEHRLSVFLYEQTGGRLSKPYYSIETMRSEANDYQHRVCDGCRLDNSDPPKKAITITADCKPGQYKVSDIVNKDGERFVVTKIERQGGLLSDTVTFEPLIEYIPKSKTAEIDGERKTLREIIQDLCEICDADPEEKGEEDNERNSGI